MPRKFTKRKTTRKPKAKKKIDKVQNRRIAKVEKQLSAQDSVAYVTNGAYNQVDDTWAIIPLTNVIAQGVTSVDRVANSIFIKKLYLYIDFSLSNVTTNVEPPQIRFGVFRSKMTGLYPSFDDAYDSNDITGLPSAEYMQKPQKLIRVRDRMGTFDTGVLQSTNTAIHSKKYKFEIIVNKRANWITDGINAASVGTGQFFLYLCQSNVYSATASNVTVYYKCQVVFTP